MGLIKLFSCLWGARFQKCVSEILMTIIIFVIDSRGPTRYRYTAGRYDLSRNRYKNSDTENRYTKTLTFATIHQQNDSLFVEVISYFRGFLRENTKTN